MSTYSSSLQAGTLLDSCPPFSCSRHKLGEEEKGQVGPERCWSILLPPGASTLRQGSAGGEETVREFTGSQLCMEGSTMNDRTEATQP